VKRKGLAISLGVLMVIVGVVWTLQGLGYIKGSVMTGSGVWAIVGPLFAGFGAGLIYVAARGGRA
jgi:hypothetical protein